MSLESSTTESLEAKLTFPAVRQRGETFPLAVFTAGFATASSQYMDFVEALALEGCAVLRYDVPGAIASTDSALVAALRSVIDCAVASPDTEDFLNADRAMLIGHSRGAKVSSLAAVADERIAGLCLLDPVDSTRWAPVSPGFPSACAALNSFAGRSDRILPVAIVGAGAGGDCAPAGSNYRTFFKAAAKPAWMVVIPGAGHAQFTDQEGLGQVQRAVCGGEAAEIEVQTAAVAVCRAWLDMTCGPMRPNDKQGTFAWSPSDVCEETADRIELSQSVTRLLLPRAGPSHRRAAVDAGVTARLTSEWLQRRGLKVESFVSL